MSIRLGRTISSPAFLLFQIIHGVSLFLVMIGVARVLLGVAELAICSDVVDGRPQPMDTHAPGLEMTNLPSRVSTTGGVQQHYRSSVLSEVSHIPEGELHVPVSNNLLSMKPTDSLALDPLAASLFFFTKLRYCFYVPLDSLFIDAIDEHARSTAAVEKSLDPVSRLRKEGNQAERIEGGGPLLGEKTSGRLPQYNGCKTRFVLQHFFAGLLCAYPLATLLQRRKLVLDFVGTIYLAYWVLAGIVLRRFFWGGLVWWASCALGMVVMYSATYLFCRRKELQEVRFTGSRAVSLGPGVPPAMTTWVRDNHTGNDMIREEIQVAVREIQRQSSGGSADVYGFSNLQEPSGRVRVPAPAQSTRRVKGVAVNVSRSSEDIVEKHKTV